MGIKNILIVDDNKLLGRNLSDILSEKGYRVSVVYNGTDAVESVKENKYRVVLMDVKMPGMSGVDTLKILKTIEPRINVIMMTAFANDEFYTQELKDIKFDIIQKPVEIEKLLEMIRQLG